MTPSRFQDPPTPSASQSVRDGPPPLSMRFNFLSAKKPIERPSGDQNGEKASSVPGSGCAESSVRERIQSCDDLPPIGLPRNTTRLPSGEIVEKRTTWFGGGRI